MSYADPSKIEEHIGDVVPFARKPARELTTEEVDAMTKGPVPPRPAAASRPELPPHLLEVPGLVGHITRWITKTSLYPQPLLALGAALAVVGTAAGRRYAGPTKAATHLYVLSIAPTGAGKNHAPKMAKRLMRAAEMGDLLGPGMFMSEPAVYQALAKQSNMLCFMDEFGSYLQRINDPKKSSGYEKAISGVLRIMWGASFDVVQPPAWAQSTSRNELKPIQSPALSIVGMSVHEEFFAALQGADIANGFLNRFLILGTYEKPEEVEPELDENDIPGALVEGLQRIMNAAATPTVARPFMGTHIADINIDWACADARLTYKGFKQSLTQRTEDPKLLSRTAEMAVRLATIRAIGRTKLTFKPEVSVDDILWGCELAMWSVERMIDDLANYMCESEFQGRANEVLRFVKQAPRQVLTHTELSRKVKNKYNSRDLRAILDALADSEMIEITRHREEGAKKPTDFVRYIGG